MTINIPQKAEQILHILNEAGYEAYVVGGCVRDSILDRVPGDWDITTSALPEQVKELFHRTVDTGIQHGTVTVMMGKEGFEVTTYRVDGEYHDGRHPDTVTFTRSLEEDLKRRDFTINAMAYHPEHGLVDLFGGMEDINRKIIRCVGDPVERLQRMLFGCSVQCVFPHSLVLLWRRIRKRHWRGCRGTWSMSVQSVSRQSL